MRDPIVDEIHRYREERSAKFKHNLAAMFEDLRRMEDESRAQGAKFVTPRRRRRRGLGRQDVAGSSRSEEPRKEPTGDPIIDEVRRVRREHSARFGHDIDAIVADIRRHEAESRKRGVKFVTPPKRKKARVG